MGILENTAKNDPPACSRWQTENFAVLPILTKPLL